MTKIRLPGDITVVFCGAHKHTNSHSRLAGQQLSRWAVGRPGLGT